MSESNVLPLEAARKNLAYVNYGSFRDNSFMQAMARLTNHKFKDPKAAYKVMKITKAIEKELPEAQELFLKTVKDYAELDEKGEIIPSAPDRPGTYKIKDECLEDWKAAYKKFNEIKADLSWPKLTLPELHGYEVSAAELDALECIVEVEGEPN